MKKMKYYFKGISGIMLCTLALSGCPGGDGPAPEAMPQEERYIEEQTEEDMEFIQMPEKEAREEKEAEPGIMEVDWSEYFDMLNGAAVIYEASDNKYMIYNRELAETQRSPCSTFKIISSLTALENGIIRPDDSVRIWSGEIFRNDEWNRDIAFQDAFRTSCVWYFREIVDEIGPDRMQTELEKLEYGNRDISDWEGKLNQNNRNRALTGFWIESSLKISPVEQAEVMERIFGDSMGYSEDTKNNLKQVMLVQEQSGADLSVYGKTGTGMEHGIVVDAWFTGFAETPEGNIYFCVYLGKSEGMDVSSSRAKEIAVRIISEYLLSACGSGKSR